MKGAAGYRIITNNPLIKRCLPETYRVELHPELDHRQILVRVRDLVYAGHRMYTHPLAGSVKPNETPYRSVVISPLPEKMAPREAMLIAEGLAALDRFPPRRSSPTEQARRDLQLIDYTLLCSALQLEPLQGLKRETIEQ